MSGRQRAPFVPRATYRRLGPSTCVCEVCGARISTNALAKAGHESGKQHLAAVEAKLTKAMATDTSKDPRWKDPTQQ